MVSLIELVAVMTIMVLIGYMVFYIALNRAIMRILSMETIQEITNSAFDYLVNTEEGQKNLFTAGGLIGSGIKQGIGLQKQGGSKGMNGLIVDLLSSFLGGRQQQQSGESAQESQSTSSTHYRTPPPM